MLTLTEEGRRVPKGAANANKKPAKGKKRPSKNDNKNVNNKRSNIMVLENKEVEMKDNVNVNHIMKEEIQIADILPVHGQVTELNSAEVTFEAGTLTEQDCQTVFSIPGLDAATNGQKYVIITLVGDDGQTLSGQLINAEEFTTVQTQQQEISNKTQKPQKKMLLLQKVDTQPAQTMQTTTTTIETMPTVTIEQPVQETVAKMDKPQEYPVQNEPVPVVNLFEDYNTLETDNPEQKDLGNWIKKFESLSLLYTECGKPFVKCPACTAMFFKSTLFEKHVSCHLTKENELYICNYCQFSNENPNLVFKHMPAHQDQCEVCNVNLTRKNSFKKHLEFAEQSMFFQSKRDKWGRYLCLTCKLGFDLNHQLQRHWFKHYCCTKKTSQCKDCYGIFDTPEALTNHVCLKCPVCGKVCDSVHRLRSHTRYEKHYLYCNICTYEFILSVDHDKHMQLHKKVYHMHKEYSHCLESDDGTSFQCELCCKIYHTMSLLLTHLHDDHQITDTTRTVTEEELNRITMTEEKDGTTSYELIALKEDDLGCHQVDLNIASQEVLVVQTERTVEKVDGETVEVDNQCQPVSLCWNRYQIEEDPNVTKSN
ncbi:zinc finger protein 64 homolog, isoforms 1 and 2-like [Trichogramma pretiosum]|uniref:zinc finger protein 64 homolog, isoforms 1 and 2-like n=1 Tax=Trichogramma pretiosum TaxID=7493 RepID=UPI0006C96141|nr:zinc finger protein 64 homolog, isoforms 1 and 2-like [Trichogramma pretiosum]XP_014220082.1 zinc finger protein 64 homolog, isoforms 1 and 2-like [Trichogramma pretiosum]XP_014220084.1 zinc finger protein 64 homolog, isoforms 1 and 2-like [Trichogramma pretiosum]